MLLNIALLHQYYSIDWNKSACEQTINEQVLVKEPPMT